MTQMKAKKIKDLKEGEFFTLRDFEQTPDQVDILLGDDSTSEYRREFRKLSARVWARGEYDRASKRYECTRWADINSYSMMKGERVVYTGFIF